MAMNSITLSSKKLSQLQCSLPKKLRHYILAHTIKLVAKIDPLKYLLNKATFTGRLVKCLMILSEFNIQYIGQRTIKGKAIADQLVEAPLLEKHPLQVEFPNTNMLTIAPKKWTPYFDGSYTQHGSGVSILFITSEGHKIPPSYRLMFS